MFYVTRFNNEPLDKKLYNLDFEKRIFRTQESYIKINSFLTDDFTFISGDSCIFWVGNNNIFCTGERCDFKTGYECIFNTSYFCHFDTKWNCVFNVPNRSKLKYLGDEFILPKDITITSPDGTLQNLKDIIVEDIKINDLNKNEIQIIINNKFYYTENKSFLPVLEAFKNKNDTEFLMRETDSRLYRHLLKTFKMN